MSLTSHIDSKSQSLNSLFPMEISKQIVEYSCEMVYKERISYVHEDLNRELKIFKIFNGIYQYVQKVMKPELRRRRFNNKSHTYLSEPLIYDDYDPYTIRDKYYHYLSDDEIINDINIISSQLNEYIEEYQNVHNKRQIFKSFDLNTTNYYIRPTPHSMYDEIGLWQTLNLTEQPEKYKVLYSYLIYDIHMGKQLLLILHDIMKKAKVLDIA